MSDCHHFCATSPENPSCAWCARHRINLDTQGRLCRRCATDEQFRSTLEKRTALREAPTCTNGSTHCAVFDTVTDPEQCARCQKEPEFRAFLYGQWIARRGSTQTRDPFDCSNREELLRVERRGCCGSRERLLRIYRCSRRGETHPGICAECLDRLPASTNKQEC